jgi:hypothetical protein
MFQPEADGEYSPWAQKQIKTAVASQTRKVLDEVIGLNPLKETTGATDTILRGIRGSIHHEITDKRDIIPTPPGGDEDYNYFSDGTKKRKLSVAFREDDLPILRKFGKSIPGDPEAQPFYNFPKSPN